MGVGGGGREGKGRVNRNNYYFKSCGDSSETNLLGGTNFKLRIKDFEYLEKSSFNFLNPLMST